MTQTKKKTLMCLAVIIVLLLSFVVSFARQGKDNIARADSSAAQNATVQQLSGVMSNGKAPATESRDGTAIGSEKELQDFLTSGNGNGYLTKSFSFSWGGRLTGALSSPDMRTLDGNGYTITLTATDVAVQNNGTTGQAESHIDRTGIKPLCAGDTTGNKWKMYMSTFFAGEGAQYPNFIDIHGGLIGFLRENQTIKNCNFVFENSILNTGSYSTPNSVSMGLVVGLCLGTIDNCSLTVNSSVTFHSGTTCQSDTWGSTALETRAAHTIAFGGFCGTMTHGNASVSNSKLTLNGDFTISIAGTNLGSKAYDDPYSRCFVGGVVGWCANSAKVYNIVTEGSGNLDATVTEVNRNKDGGRGRALSGIVAAITGGDNADGIASLGGMISTCGIINGVINKWEGRAKFLTYDTDYSPTGVEQNDLQYLIVGVTGRRDSGSTDATVSDVFVSSNIYTGDKYSIALDYTKYPNNRGTEGKNFGRQYSTNIITQEMPDGSYIYKSASDTNAYLAFSGTGINSPLWAVYDLKSNDNKILWSRSYAVNDGSENREYYYDQATSIEDAKKFDVTHIEISRGNSYKQNQNYTIKFDIGRAVYYTQSTGQTILEGDLNSTADVTLQSIDYGESLTVPTLKLYSDKEHTNYIRSLTDDSYWQTMGSKSNKIQAIGQMDPDTYRSFIFITSSGGRNYDYIHFVNTTNRYVSYIYDNPQYIAYAAAHPGYSPVKDGEKQKDWQQRIIQQVNPKLVGIDWGYNGDITENSDSRIQYDSTGAIISYKQFSTMYDGDPVVFSLELSGVQSGDECIANYEYRMWDSYLQEYKKVDSCVNAGKYKVVVTSLTNSKYGLSSSFYSIDFDIGKRKIGLINTMEGKKEGDAYLIEMPYEAKDIMLAEKVGIFETENSANASSQQIKLFNVLNEDKEMIRFDYLAVGDEELDMRNVGKFEMRMSMQSGINSGNYIMPDVTRYIVQITEADAKLTSEKGMRYTYPYGYFVMDMVEPFVKAEGVDGTALTFDGYTYYIQEKNGEYSETAQEPFDAGKYKITYHFLNSAYTNYKDQDITVEVIITPRQVNTSYTGIALDENGESLDIELENGKPKDIQLEYGETIADIKVTFQRQNSSGEGIFAYEYSASKSVTRFNKLDGSGNSTDIWVDKAVDAGKYLVEIDIDFDIVTTSSGWQTNEQTKYNYTVAKDKFYVVISPRTVYVDIKGVTRDYGDELPQLIGGANESNDARAWAYTADKGENNIFEDADNIFLLPQLSNTDIYAYAGKYSISIPDGIDYRTGSVVDYKDKDGNKVAEYNKINNYIIAVSNASNNELYVIEPRTVKVEVYLNTNVVTYGNDLPECTGWKVIGEKNFIEADGIELTVDWNGVEKGSDVGNYEVSLKIVQKQNRVDVNYQLEMQTATTFDIIPKTLTIISAELDEEEDYANIIYDGEVHRPTVTAEFVEEDVSEEIEFKYNYFEIVDGVMSTEATENPQYAGKYRVFIADIVNKNYNVVFGEEYERLEIYMTIQKRTVNIDVLPANRIYSVTGSLTPVGDPYKYSEDTPYKFAESDALNVTMYTDEYYKDLGEIKGVVKLLFDGLVPDPKALDENGNWITQEIQGSDGSTIQIIVPQYRNYDIQMNLGDLNVLGANLQDIEKYVNLRNSQEVYNGQDRYEDFRVLTSNENILNALQFRVFRYVEISSLSASEANTLVNESGKYTRSLEDDKYVYTRDDAEGTYVRKYLSRIENGDDVDEKLVDAGQYFKHITPAPAAVGIFDGECIRDFYITKAERQISADDINVSVHYNEISLSSDIEGMEVSLNDEAFVNKNNFADLKPNTDYTVKVRFAESGNYLRSNEVEFNLHTGIDISAIQNTLAKFDKINFANVAEYEEKVLAFMGSVSQDDMSFIDQAKYAKLQASYEQLLRGANSVVAGAQKVGATAVGKSGKSVKTTSTIALSMSGVGMLMAGLTFFAKKKKEDEQDADTRSVKKAKSAGVKRASKVIVMAAAVVLVCLTVFVGCQPSSPDGDDGGFSKADLYKIASYNNDTHNGARDLTIEVKSDGVTLYKYDKGEEKIDKRLTDVSNIAFGAEGAGFDFDDLYFINSQFTVEGEIATFNADIKESLVFLGVNNALNGKVSVVVNTATEKLETIDVSYDVVNAGITYNVTIAVKAR